MQKGRTQICSLYIELYVYRVFVIAYCEYCIYIRATQTYIVVGCGCRRGGLISLFCVHVRTKIASVFEVRIREVNERLLCFVQYTLNFLGTHVACFPLTCCACCKVHCTRYFNKIVLFEFHTKVPKYMHTWKFLE